jgi:hypothetical protein
VEEASGRVEGPVGLEGVRGEGKVEHLIACTIVLVRHSACTKCVCISQGNAHVHVCVSVRV